MRCISKNCVIRKQITKPSNSPELAEFVGIVLGDGGIGSSHQVVITLHRYNHKEYIGYVAALIKTLFGIEPAIYHYRTQRSRNISGVTITSTSVVEFLLEKGLKRGNKVKNQVEVPNWIRRNKKFSVHCLRGLVDTDGCVYRHHHSSRGYPFYNIGLTFTNKSVPLLHFVHLTLQSNGFSARYQEPQGVYLYRESEVVRYAKEVGFSNLYHMKRLNSLLKEKEMFIKDRSHSLV